MNTNETGSFSTDTMVPCVDGLSLYEIAMFFNVVSVQPQNPNPPRVESVKRISVPSSPQIARLEKP